MAAWLLVWNPDNWEWNDYDEECKKASKENPIDLIWSCSSKKVQIGDEFYLIKLGNPPRGIIAHGTVTQSNFDYEDWNKDRARQDLNHIAGKCDTLLNYKTQDILDVSVLDEKCKGQLWHPQQSGIQIQDKVLPTLQELWAEVTKDYPDNPEESVLEENDDGASGIVEGTKKSVYTTTYERDPNVRRTFLKGKQELKCEVCGFDFKKAYGKLGAGYIEVHHKKPVSEGVRMTDLNNDLAMLCSNCHRMIHRGRDHMITVEELKGIVDANA